MTFDEMALEIRRLRAEGQALEDEADRMTQEADKIRTRCYAAVDASRRMEAALLDMARGGVPS